MTNYVGDSQHYEHGREYEEMGKRLRGQLSKLTADNFPNISNNILRLRCDHGLCWNWAHELITTTVYKSSYEPRSAKGHAMLIDKLARGYAPGKEQELFRSVLNFVVHLKLHSIDNDLVVGEEQLRKAKEHTTAVILFFAALVPHFPELWPKIYDLVYRYLTVPLGQRNRLIAAAVLIGARSVFTTPIPNGPSAFQCADLALKYERAGADTAKFPDPATRFALVDVLDEWAFEGKRPDSANRKRFRKAWAIVRCLRTCRRLMEKNSEGRKGLVLLPLDLLLLIVSFMAPEAKNFHQHVRLLIEGPEDP